jgi:hypothetical protein
MYLKLHGVTYFEVVLFLVTVVITSELKPVLCIRKITVKLVHTYYTYMNTYIQT